MRLTVLTSPYMYVQEIQGPELGAIQIPTIALTCLPQCFPERVQL